MQGLFKEKVSKFGALISLIGVTILLALFFLFRPEVMGNSAGQVFALLWSVTAILVFAAHARTLANQRPRQATYLVQSQELRANKSTERYGAVRQRTTRFE